MPLFKSTSRSSSGDNKDNNAPARQRSIFSKRTPSPQNNNHRTTSDTDSNNGSRNGSARNGGFFGMGRNHGHNIHNDPSIVSARQKVTNAEVAEREADEVLTQARNKVKEAKRQVEMLEREALEDAHRAKMKQTEAKVVRKSARALGRHG